MIENKKAIKKTFLTMIENWEIQAKHTKDEAQKEACYKNIKTAKQAIKNLDRE